MSVSLLTAVLERQPYCGEGVCSLPPDVLRVFLSREPWNVPLNKDAALQDLERLAGACGPDGELARADFAVNVDLASSGVLQAATDALLGLDAEEHTLKAELRMLHVQSSGYQLPAQSTSPNVFGCLLLTFPVTHTGGSTVVRSGTQELVHDPSAAAVAPDEHQVSWLAFRNDAERQSAPVQSGYRVTLSYDLHLVEKSVVTSRQLRMHARPILDVFRELLADPTFLPTGGRIGIPLQNEYAAPAKVEYKDPGRPIENVRQALRGVDYAFFLAAGAAGLRPKVLQVYSHDYDQGTFLVDRMFHGWDSDCTWMDADDFGEEMCKHGEKIESVKLDPMTDEVFARTPKKNLQWLKPYTDSKTVFRCTYPVSYGCRDGQMSTIDGYLVIVARVPPKDKRTGVVQDVMNWSYTATDADKSKTGTDDDAADDSDSDGDDSDEDMKDAEGSDDEE
ncbi:hypothetical protein EXIGLDRAFT_841681 [Exidia glandulosa HHB12029]|uniref:Uncharacterized protein n=1 Tax=Exidia glandulosa HHB12029 TaxID=1314781 RepID=A0A165DQF2_EXIGL|nr:hypothetical protein EXIGLDRAFT_841681 [Exidia glandulosa HHB12029]